MKQSNEIEPEEKSQIAHYLLSQHFLDVNHAFDDVDEFFDELK